MMIVATCLLYDVESTWCLRIEIPKSKSSKPGSLQGSGFRGPEA